MAGQPNGVAAFVEAFGNSYAQGYNRRVQAQLAQKNAQNAAIAETLVTSGAENPDLWQNQTFLKAANEVLGKDNAAAVAEAQIAHKQSGMGQLIDALRRIPTAAVSAEANGPGTGPSVPFNELNPVQQTQVARDRLSQITPAEAGLGFSPAVGNLVRDTALAKTKPPLNAEGLTPAQAKNAQLREQGMKDANARFQQDQAGKAEDRNLRRFRTARDTAMGVEVDRQIETPLGDVLPYKARRVVQPDGSIIETPVSVKLEKPPAAMLDKFQGLNTGIRAASQLKDMLSADPAEIQQILIPFAGKKLDEIQAAAGTLTPKQRKFLSLVNELRAQRSFALGGKNLTLNELQVMDGILPGVSEAASTFPIIVQHALDTLTEMGVDTENAARQSGIRAPRTLMTPYNKDLIAHVRKRTASLPGATIVSPPGTVDTTGMPKGPAATSADEAAVNDAFLAP